MADTPDQKVAERLAGAAEGAIVRLQLERAELARAPDRIAEIDAELAILQDEKVRLEPRRPRERKPVEEAQDTKVRSQNVNATRT